MKCSVIIPVGPGHEKLAQAAERSVLRAVKNDRGPFDSIAINLISDDDGRGRSATRNQGFLKAADWYFLLDADDEMMPDALPLVDLQYCATFGSVCLNGKVTRKNVWPVTRDTLFERGAVGTLSMGCFVRGDLAVRFDESLDVGEDFDFYMRLPNFTKIHHPLVSIGYDKPSASGPRGYTDVDWIGACNKIISKYAH